MVYDDGATVFGVVLSVLEGRGYVLAEVDSARGRGYVRIGDVIAGRALLKRFEVTPEKLRFEHEIAEAREAYGYTEVR